MTTPPGFGWTFAVTSSAWFVIALERLVVTTALPVIRTDLGADLAGADWTVSAYTLAFAVLLPAGAAMGDRFGRRRMFAVGMAVFTAGSAAAALAPTIGWAGGRGLAVHPGFRGHGVAAALMAAVEDCALGSTAPAFVFHTSGFMTTARALYERLGYRRAPSSTAT